MAAVDEKKPIPLKGSLKKAQAALRAYALTLPEAVEELPWGHPAIKVRKKTFVFISGTKTDKGYLGLSMKLPISAEMALELPFTKPTGYGLGKSGWVSSTFTLEEDVPVDMLKEWIVQSYRAVAPKKLGKLLV